MRRWSIFSSYIIRSVSIANTVSAVTYLAIVPCKSSLDRWRRGEEGVQQLTSNDQRKKTDRFTETWTLVSRHHEELVQHDGFVVRVYQSRRPATQLQWQPAGQLQRRASRPQEAFVGGPTSELWGQQTKELGPGCGAWPANVRRPPHRSSDKTYV